MSNYDFATLSSKDFEELARDLLQCKIGLTFESFTAGRDNGIDLRHRSDENHIIVQCKHYHSSSFSKLKSNLGKELSNVKNINPKRYIIVTSLGLTPGNKDEIMNIFTPYCQSTADVLGKDDLNKLLAEYPMIEKNHFKLWITSVPILESIIHGSIKNYTSQVLELITQKARMFVEHDGFNNALNILNEHHYCILSGIPGSGKTTNAEMLLLHSIAEGFVPVIISKDIEQAYTLLVDRESKQVFFYDDFLGQTSLKVKLGKKEDSRLLDFIEIISRNSQKRLIFNDKRLYIK